MENKDMEKLFQNYLSGDISPQEELAVVQYLSKNSLEDAPVFADEKEEIRKRIKSRLMESVGHKRIRPVYIRLAAAACVILAATAAVFFLPSRQYAVNVPFITSLQPTRADDLEVRNTSARVHTITLEDGSTVALQPNSSLSYPEHFDSKKRRVSLTGEAFFNITKNPSRPFLVTTEGLTTQVLGTSFSIKSYENKESIEVAVATGKVSVFENNEQMPQTNNGVILTPNQKIVFNKRSRKIEFGIVARPNAIKPIESKRLFEFEDRPVGEVLETLETIYGIDVIAESDAFEKCLFTGDLNNLNMFEQLDVLCKSVNGTYERRGSSLFIQGEGCH